MLQIIVNLSQQFLIINIHYLSYLTNCVKQSEDTDQLNEDILDKISESNYFSQLMNTILADYRYMLKRKEIKNYRLKGIDYNMKKKRLI